MQMSAAEKLFPNMHENDNSGTAWWAAHTSPGPAIYDPSLSCPYLSGNNTMFEAPGDRETEDTTKRAQRERHMNNLLQHQVHKCFQSSGGLQISLS
jgi:hypothetical protein